MNQAVSPFLEEMQHDPHTFVCIVHMFHIIFCTELPHLTKVSLCGFSLHLGDTFFCDIEGSLSHEVHQGTVFPAVGHCTITGIFVSITFIFLNTTNKKFSTFAKYVSQWQLHSSKEAWK
jgi:hypothetical protein